MAIIHVKSGDNIEISIKRFRKEVEKENIVKEIKERQFYKKPALVRKIEADKLEKRIKKSMRRRRAQLRRMI